MILDFEIDGNKYDYRKDAPGDDGVYVLDVANKTYVLVDIVTTEIQAEVDRLLLIETSIAYKSTRKDAYDLLNQDELRFDDLVNSTTTWVDAINAIKAQYPKP